VKAQCPHGLDLRFHLREGKLSGTQQRHYQVPIAVQLMPMLMMVVPMPIWPILHRDLLLCPKLPGIHQHTYGEIRQSEIHQLQTGVDSAQLGALSRMFEDVLLSADPHHEVHVAIHEHVVECQS